MKRSATGRTSLLGLKPVKKEARGTKEKKREGSRELCQILLKMEPVPFPMM